MKWIKASERLPDKEMIDKYFNLKLGGFPAVGKFIQLYGQTMTFDIDKYGTVSDLKKSKVEWLDEMIWSMEKTQKQTNMKGIKKMRLIMQLADIRKRYPQYYNGLIADIRSGIVNNRIISKQKTNY